MTSKRRQTGQLCEDQKLQQAEIVRLKRENARLEEEVAFLKKAAAYFAKLPSEVRHDQGQRKSIPHCYDVQHDIGFT